MRCPSGSPTTRSIRREREIYPYPNVLHAVVSCKRAGDVRRVTHDESIVLHEIVDHMSSMDSSDLHEVLECPVCMRLLYQPVTPPCGHSFCSHCLLAILDRSAPKCPLCRCVFHTGLRDVPVSKVLEQVIQRLYPEEMSAIAAEEAAARLDGPADGGALARRDLPLFVMSAILPFEPMALNIFEPRYRLLVRRAMEGRRRFGMVGLDGNTPQHIVTEVEIETCETQPDGRYHIEVRGLKRYTFEAIGYQDDYAVAKNVTPYEDDADEDVERVAALERRLDRELHSGKLIRVDGVRDLYRGQARDARTTGWVGAVVLTLMRSPDVHRFKYEMLRETSLERRLNRVSERWPTQLEDDDDDE